MSAITHAASTARPLTLGLLTACTLLFLTLSTGSNSGPAILAGGLGMILLLALTLSHIHSLRALQDEQQKRQTAESELRDSEARQHAIIDTMVDAAIVIDKNGTVQSINPAAETMFGYPPGEVIGQNIKMLMPEPYRSEHDGYLAHHLVTGEKRVLGKLREVEAMHRDGSVFPIELAVTEVYIHGERLFSGIVRDISERKKTNTLKDEFVATVSHELRTPLTSIRGSLGLLTGGAAGELPAQASALLELAHNNSERLLLLINDLLDMDKIASGKMAFHFSSIAVIPFVEEALAANRVYAEQYDVKHIMTRQIDHAHVQGDKDRLLQVIANLLSNASKFSPRGGTVEINVNRHNEQIRISVSDHGPGIPDEFHSKLFEKFTQADGSDSRQVGGTGLGLCISRAIVEKHGGQIGFTTQLGSGSTFYVDLPEVEAPPEQKSE